jgi:peptidoglycan/xylan/chitin deacetylase (PgdA/CDA1 family)
MELERYHRGTQPNTGCNQDLHILKELLLAGITSDPALKLLAPLRPRCATLLMMHRFAMPDLGVQGHDPVVLARHLEYLRRRGYTLLSLMDLVERLDNDIPLRRNALVFTVDDGYADFAEVAAPVFASYDCPVTVFLVTDFVSGRQWNWFDRVSWAFAHSPRRDVSFEITGQRLRLQWSNASQCERSSRDAIRRFKTVTDATKERLIQTVSAALEVEVPERAPKEYKAMGWDEVRACARNGVTFGPHTVTHPILSRVDDRRAREEIGGSWQMVREATDAAVPVFCYPNGGPADFSAREKAFVRDAGMKAAVSGVGGCVELDGVTNGSTDRFSLPRFPYYEHKPRFVQIASGIEAMKTRMRKPFALR